MPGLIKVVFKNRAVFLSRMERKARRIRNARAPMIKVLDLIENSIVGGVMTDKTDVDGKSFTALTRQYAARKTRRFGSKPILVASGKMLERKNFKKQATRKEGVIEYKAPRKVMTRALTHQEPITSGLPQRKWWGLRKKIVPLIMVLLGKHIRISVRG